MAWFFKFHINAVLVNNLGDKMINPNDQFNKDNAQLKSNSDDDKSATNEMVTISIPSLS